MIIYYEENGIMRIEIEENKELFAHKFPHNLTDLYLTKPFNKSIKQGILPLTLRKIIFGRNYNQEILPNVLPINLKFLQFDSKFTHVINIDILPKNLTHLIFNGGYYHPITQNTLPKNLIQLSFSYNKYELTKYVLPKSLTHLKLGYDYNYEFKKNVLPENIVYLELGGIYSHILSEVPQTLKTLYICGSKENELVVNNLPNTIENLIFYNLEIPILNLPISVKYIKLICYSDLTLNYVNKIPFGCQIFDRFNNEINTDL